MKNKQMHHEINPNRRAFLIEITGAILLFCSFFIFFELGRIGYGFKIILHVIFGDWYFCFVGLCGYLGFRFLFFHKGVKLHTLSFQGILFIFLGIMMLSHASVHSFLIRLGKNTFSSLFSLYINYIKSYDPNLIFGGGIIGGVIYEALCFVIGSIGTCIFASILIILGIIYATNHTLAMALESLKKSRVYLIRTGKKISNFFKTLELPKGLKRVSNNSPDLSLLSGYASGYQEDLQNKYMDELEKRITHRISVETMNCSYFIKKRMSNLYFELEYKIPNMPSKNALKSILDGEIKEQYYVEAKIDHIMIQINSPYKEILPLRNLLEKKQRALILGRNIEKEVVILNPNHSMCILSDKNENRIQYLHSLLLSIPFSFSSYQIFYLDIYKEFSEAKLLSNIQYENESTFLSKIVNELHKISNERQEILDKSKEISLSFDPVFVFLPECIELSRYQGREDIKREFLYLLQVSKRLQIQYIFLLEGKYELDDIILASIDSYLILYTKKINKSVQIIGSEYPFILTEKYDALYSTKHEVQRITLPFLSSSDFDRILRFYAKK